MTAKQNRKRLHEELLSEKGGRVEAMIQRVDIDNNPGQEKAIDESAFTTEVELLKPVPPKAPTRKERSVVKEKTRDEIATIKKQVEGDSVKSLLYDIDIQRMPLDQKDKIKMLQKYSCLAAFCKHLAANGIQWSELERRWKLNGGKRAYLGQWANPCRICGERPISRISRCGHANFCKVCAQGLLDSPKPMRFHLLY